VAREPAVTVARIAAGVFSVGLLVLTLSPLARDPRQPKTDGYPLSTFPMFAEKRATKLTITYALGDDPSGARTLTPSLVGTGEVLQARSMLDKAVAGGPRRIAELCAQIAARVAADDDYDDVTAIRIVTGTHDAVEYLIDGKHGPEKLRGQCDVKR
jgi:hypothetical protein